MQTAQVLVTSYKFHNATAREIFRNTNGLVWSLNFVADSPKAVCSLLLTLETAKIREQPGS